jgi:hypothetical protein
MHSQLHGNTNFRSLADKGTKGFPIDILIMLLIAIKNRIYSPDTWSYFNICKTWLYFVWR